MTNKVSELPAITKQELPFILKDKRTWNFKGNVLKGPNLKTMQLRLDNIVGYRWQEEVFFPLYWRMLHLLRVVHRDDEKWNDMHIHVAHANGKDQEYFECQSEVYCCDEVINDRLQLIQDRYQWDHPEWERVEITQELVDDFGWTPAGQLTLL